jgi:phage-related minor tail protein
MAQLIDIQQRAETETLALTGAQQALHNVMASPAWNDMPQAWRDLIETQAEAARQAETLAMATGEYDRFLSEMDALNQDAAKSTLELDDAMSALYDLMLSPAWQQMTEAQRQAAAAAAEAASGAQKQATAQADRLKFSDMKGDLSRAISQGLFDGFSNGGNLVESLAVSLRGALNNYAQKGLEDGISAALKVASKWIAELFTSMSSSSQSGSGSGWGAVFSAIASFFASAQGNAFTAAGPVRAFAAGGAFGRGEVLTRPTYFHFAQGGSWRNGVAGEAGPEAALPLKRLADGRLGVSTDGAGGGGVHISIVINADGSRDESGTSGDARDYTALARRIEGVVRGVITTEQRPGGLLATTRV